MTSPKNKSTDKPKLIIPTSAEKEAAENAGAPAPDTGAGPVNGAAPVSDVGAGEDTAVAMEASCGACLFFVARQRAANQPLTGFCRRNPPVPLLSGMQMPMFEGQPPQPIINTFWPVVGAQHWCGEWKRANREPTN